MKLLNYRSFFCLILPVLFVTSVTSSEFDNKFDYMESQLIITKKRIFSTIDGNVTQTHNEEGQGRISQNINCVIPKSPTFKWIITPHDYLEQASSDYSKDANYFLPIGTKKHMRFETYTNIAVCKHKQNNISETIQNYQYALDLESNDIPYSGLMQVHYEIIQDAKDDINYLIKEQQKAEVFGSKIMCKYKNDSNMLERKEGILKEALSVISVFSSPSLVVQPAALASIIDLPTFIERPIPPVTHKFEGIYRRFIQGRLVYNGPAGEKSFLFTDFVNPLKGKFNLDGLTFEDHYDKNKVKPVNQYLRIRTGYKTIKENDSKVTYWIIPWFMIDQEITCAFKIDYDKPVDWTSGVGVFLTYRNNKLMKFGRLTTIKFDEISGQNLYNLAGTMWHDRRVRPWWTSFCIYF